LFNDAVFPLGGNKESSTVEAAALVGDWKQRQLVQAIQDKLAAQKEEQAQKAALAKEHLKRSSDSGASGAGGNHNHSLNKDGWDVHSAATMGMGGVMTFEGSEPPAPANPVSKNFKEKLENLLVNLHPNDTITSANTSKFHSQQEAPSISNPVSSSVSTYHSISVSNSLSGDDPSMEVRKYNTISISSSSSIGTTSPVRTRPKPLQLQDRTSSASMTANGGVGVAMPPPTLTSIVWKLRSGYGKFSVRNAWERRRLSLVGRKVFYYKVLEDGIDDGGASTSRGTSPTQENVVEEASQGGISEGTATVSSSSSLVQRPSTDHDTHGVDQQQTISPPMPQSKTKMNFWEQAKEDIKRAHDTVLTNLQLPNALDGSKEKKDTDPRGSVDFIAEPLTVAPISNTSQSVGYTQASVCPTPFGILLLKNGECKWKVCFDTQREQVEWLAALTEVVVGNSVETYNQELVKMKSAPAGANVWDVLPKKAEEEGNGFGFGDNPRDMLLSSPREKDGLWRMDTKLSFKNVVKVMAKHEESKNVGESDQPDTTENESEGSLQETIDDDAKSPMDISSSCDPCLTLKLHVRRLAHMGPTLSLKGTNLLISTVTVNVAMIYTRQSSILFFLFICVLLNSTLYFLIIDENGSPDECHRPTTVTGQTKGKNIDKRRGGKVANDVFQQKGSATDTCDRSTYKGFRPMAGSTAKMVTNSTDSQFINNIKFPSYMSLGSDKVMVRSHGYLQTKKKIPCPHSLYELFAVDVIGSDMRLGEMVKRVKLPPVSDDPRSKTWNSPHYFVISLAVPTESPSFGRHENDGVGMNVTAYYKMKDETRTILQRITAPDFDPQTDSLEDNLDLQKRYTNGVRLWEEWCTNAPSDDKMQARFKLIPNVHNPREVGLPSYMSKYCGKPVLIKRKQVTGFLSCHPEIQAMEFDISIHPFPYLAKKATAYMKENLFSTALAGLSYAIEGRDDTELPEVLIGDEVQICYPDPESVIEANDLFAGTAPSSLSEDSSGKKND
jgi:hypothetical protein